MPEYSFDDTQDRRRSGSLKWDLHDDGDALPFWVADMDFESPPEVVAFMEDRASHGVYGYAHPKTSEVEAVLSYLDQRHGIAAEGRWLVWLPGLVPSLSVAAGVAKAQGAGSSLTCTPVYPPFLSCPSDAGLESLTVALCEGGPGRSTFDREAMETAVRPDTGLFILCNPHNPVGRVYRREELDWLGAFCQRHDLLLCSDEVHCDLIFDEEATPHLSLLHLDPELRERSMVLMSASKTYNIAGIGCAFAVIPDGRLRKAFCRVMGGWLPPVNVFGYGATEAAFRYGEPWRRALLGYLQDNHRFLMQYMEEHHPRLVLASAEATYLAWLDVRPLGLERPATYFQGFGITLSDGTDFGTPGYLRWNVGCSRTHLAEGLRRFSRGADDLKG